MQFRLTHRDGDGGSAAPGRPARVWRTCLREVAFLDDAAGDVPGALTGGAAYALLLEIICGLRSPILAETQVMGQFRAFLAGLTRADAELRGIGEQALTDARRVRQAHLRGISSGSYGGEVRRLLQHYRAISLVGRGALASELLPYLRDCAEVQDWTRADVAAPASRPLTVRPSALVIAAPLTNLEIEGVASRHADLRHVVDLRAASERRPLPHPRVTTLDDVFEAAGAAALASVSRVEAARAQIQELAQAFASRRVCRPFGWEDLCA